jgi:uroporphyrinogen decarboxylase
MATPMRGRERILASISHQQPDKIPIDFGSTKVSSIVLEGYERLKTHFGIFSETVLLDKMQRIVEVDEAILQTLNIDTRGIFQGEPTLKNKAEDLGLGRYRDIWGVERAQPEGSYYYDIVKFPLAGEITLSDIGGYPWPDPNDPGSRIGVKNRLSWIRKNTDCAAILSLPPPFIHISQYLRGFYDWYLDFMLHTNVLEALFDAVLEINMEIAKNLLMEVGQEVDIVYCADDLGTQNGPQVSPDHFKKYLKPRLFKFLRQVHDLSPCKILFHTCGSVAPLLDDLIEIGVDVLNPVQISAKGMDPVELRRKYKGKLAFWGAMDTQKILPHGSVEDVKKMVEERIEQMGEGGGYVLTSVHKVQPDVPLDNLLAMFQHARDYVPSFAKS